MLRLRRQEIDMVLLSAAKQLSAGPVRGVLRAPQACRMHGARVLRRLRRLNIEIGLRRDRPPRPWCSGEQSRPRLWRFTDGGGRMRMCWSYIRNNCHWRNNVDTLASSGRKGLTCIAVMMNPEIDS
jgi:hypothetical protein